MLHKLSQIWGSISANRFLEVLPSVAKCVSVCARELEPHLPVGSVNLHRRERAQVHLRKSVRGSGGAIGEVIGSNFSACL